MALTGVLRPGHVAIRVLEMAPALKHYVDVLGLTEVARDKKGRVFLKAWDEHDHHSVVLREADEAGMDYMGWRVDSPATLKKLAGAIEKSDLCSDLEWIPAGEHPKTGERFRFTIPTGHVMELFAEKEKLGNNCGVDGPNINPNPWPDGLHGIAPSRFDHCLLYGDDLDGTVKLFTEVLGFGIAEQVMTAADKKFMIGAFLSCSNKAHDVAFIRQPVKGKFHHASFELGSWEKVLRAADILSRTKTSIDIGPTRHGITRGETVYFFDPSGNRNEVFAGGYIYYPDKPPITWYDETLGPGIFYHDRQLNEAAFYGKKQKYAYWDGFSTGGRQGYKLAQKYPGDFDGILAGAPAFNWTKFITNELYPQVVKQRELGGPLALTKLNAVSTAAVASCGGSTLGFLLDPLQCRYDPTKDAAALCPPAGTNSDPTKCVTLTGAAAIDRIWYGETTDGTYADPAIDNAAGPFPIAANHLWFGLTRGATLGALAGIPPFSIASVQVALELQDPPVAQTVPAGTFVNATGNGADKWNTLSYAQLANAFYLGIALQPAFSDINTDSPDLSGARDAGTKVLSYHGMADQLIMPQGSINYFTRTSAMMGGNVALQKFDRLFLIPGMSHDGTFTNNNSTSGSLDPATGAVTSVNKVPLPQPSTGRDELFEALLDWVEDGNAPVRIDLSSANGSVTMPICMYPLKATYKGSGSVTGTDSYDCR